jgi:hypothetical protein
MSFLYISHGRLNQRDQFLSIPTDFVLAMRRVLPARCRSIDCADLKHSRCLSQILNVRVKD